MGLINYMKEYKKETFLETLQTIPYTTTRRTKKKPSYVNLPMSFDIETSSFYEGDNKRAIMYIWMFAVSDYAFYGRTWDSFTDLLNCLHEFYGLNDKLMCMIYVHNLAFEFSFICNRIEWDNVFALEERQPVSCRSKNGIEFRCSYILSGYSLAKVAENLHEHTIRKLTGDLDYTVLRTSETSLSSAELAYCENDVLIVTAYISECIKEEGDISKIPLTQTGYVRRYVHDLCLPRWDKKSMYKYHDMMQDMTLTVQDYKQLHTAFQGGFTHANAYYANETIRNVSSLDFTSAYPYVMCSEMFPCSTMKSVEVKGIKELREYMKYYCVIMDCLFTDLTEQFEYDHYISTSSCTALEGEKVDNGRVISAKRLLTTITEIDFKIIEKCYKWKSLKIGNVYIMKKAYLPFPILDAILTLYENKTKLKGVADKEVEYMHDKQLLNCVFGMCVTAIIRDESTFDNYMGWITTEAKEAEQIENNNQSWQRFLYYPWGIYVTAYNRYNLWRGIFEFRDDYIYSDTDSIKCVNYEAHKAFIESYNEECETKLKRMCRIRKIDYSRCAPETIKGTVKPLGVWDYEGTYDRFKTLGAKRYMTEVNSEISITVSGLNKRVAVPYICRGWSYTLERKEQNSPFNRFKDGLKLERGETGRLIHTYLDNEYEGDCVDYRGNTFHFNELSGVHLEASEYELGLSAEYSRLVNERLLEYVRKKQKTR